MRCCICGKDMSGQPVMQDNNAGVVYCMNDYSYFDSFQHYNPFTACKNCGFKFSKEYSEFYKGKGSKCPACGKNLD